MTRSTFQKQNETRWRELESTLDRLDGKKTSQDGPARPTPEDIARFPGMFRQVCNDLSLAQHRMYGVRLCDRLNLMVIRGYKHLYQELGGGWEAFLRFVWYDLPNLVRKEWRLFWLCNLVFWLPFAAMLISGQQDPRWIHATLGPEGMAGMEQMYGKGQDLSDLRSHFGSNFYMFTFYIMNNIGIDFRIFAGGILGGLGTLFFLLFNGIHLGASFGYAWEACDARNFHLFVIGHSSWEFMGMILAGVAGMRLGLGILNPGRLTRKRALVEAGKTSFKLVAGAAGMTLIAAFIEGFWSANEFPATVKFTFGWVMWAIVAAYLFLAGRGMREA